MRLAPRDPTWKQIQRRFDYLFNADVSGFELARAKCTKSGVEKWKYKKRVSKQLFHAQLCEKKVEINTHRGTEEKFVECGSWDFPWWSTQWINDVDDARSRTHRARKRRPFFAAAACGDDIDCHAPILRALIYLCSSSRVDGKHIHLPTWWWRRAYTAVAKQGLELWIMTAWIINFPAVRSLSISLSLALRAADAKLILAGRAAFFSRPTDRYRYSPHI